MIFQTLHFLKERKREIFTLTLFELIDFERKGIGVRNFCVLCFFFFHFLLKRHASNFLNFFADFFINKYYISVSIWKQWNQVGSPGIWLKKNVQTGTILILVNLTFDCTDVFDEKIYVYPNISLMLILL